MALTLEVKDNGAVVAVFVLSPNDKGFRATGQVPATVGQHPLVIEGDKYQADVRLTVVGIKEFDIVDGRQVPNKAYAKRQARIGAPGSVQNGHKVPGGRPTQTVAGLNKAAGRGRK